MIFQVPQHFYDTVCSFFKDTSFVLYWIYDTTRIEENYLQNPSINKPKNAHIISYKIILKHFKIFRHVSILSDHHQGALFLAKVMLQDSQFNSYLQASICCHNTSLANTN